MDGVILLGPFGSGKTHLGHALSAAGIAQYEELEPLVYERFGQGEEFDVESASAFIREHYYERLESEGGPQVFESTGITQRPLVLEVQAKYQIGLVRVVTPKSICLERVATRHRSAERSAQIENASTFFDRWCEEVAPSFDIILDVSGTDDAEATRAIAELLNRSLTTPPKAPATAPRSPSPEGS